MLSRRHFLASTAAASLAGFTKARAAETAPAFSIIVMGDLHFDRMDHHDLKWLEENKAGDLSQIRNYTRLTAEVMPQVFETVRRQIGVLRESATPPAFVLQVGDLVEGLCGTEDLAARQNREALDFLSRSDFGIPFLFTKGNHDVTGDGAVAAFNHVLQPFMAEQARQIDPKAAPAAANYTARFGDAEFAFFDAYDKSSLDWFEAAAAARTARHLIVTVHPPVVPYGARAAWHLYAGDKSKAQREKMLSLLGRQEAIVLGGHLHKFACLSRTAGKGRFTQLAVSSVVSSPNQGLKDRLKGIDLYNGDQVELEPNHSPETEAERRAIYGRERPAVTSFEYADTAGYAIVTVDSGTVKAQVFAGTSATPFETVRLAG